jgi:hypothetical protein
MKGECKMGIGGTIVIAVIVIIGISGLTLWMTKIAYSRKWDEED